MEKNLEILRPLIYAIELRDHYTRGHSQRVAVYAREFGKYIGLEESETEKLYISGLLHDIGKIAIPDNILLKPSLLTVKEYDVIKYHPVLSADLVDNINEFKDLVSVIRHHHENYDGSGYPDKLSGENIPFLSRILTIADVFDALSTDRIYRDAFSLEESLDLIENMKYKFDPRLLGKFFVFIKKFGLCKDNTDLIEEKELQKIRKLRETVFFEDMLTGLLNKNGLMLLIKKAISFKKKITLIKFEIENFKFINSKRGIITTDKIIKLTASEIKNNINVTLTTQEIQNGDIFAVRDSGGKFLFLIIENNTSVNDKLDEIEMKVKSLFKEVRFQRSVLLEDKEMDYNFEKAVEYVL